MPLGRMSVREQRPLRETLYFAVIVIALGVAGYLAYANGRATSAMRYLSASTDRDRLVSEVDELESQNRGLRERIALLERTGQVERKAYADVDEHLKDLEDEIFDLKEEVAFYRDIVSARREKGLNIQSLDILPVGTGSDYRYRLVLTKDMRNDKVVTGKRIGCRQGHRKRDQSVDADVDDRIDIAGIPGLVSEDLKVVAKSDISGIERKYVEDIGIGAQRHVEHPVDGQHQKKEVNQQPDGSLLNFHEASPLPTFCNA